MTTISRLTPISYERPCSLSEKALSKLSHYFYLGGVQASVIQGNNVQLKDGKTSWKIVALKVASYILLFPLTLVLLTTYQILRHQHTFIVNPSSHPPISAVKNIAAPPLASPSAAPSVAQPPILKPTPPETKPSLPPTSTSPDFVQLASPSAAPSPVAKDTLPSQNDSSKSPALNLDTQPLAREESKNPSPPEVRPSTPPTYTSPVQPKFDELVQRITQVASYGIPKGVLMTRDVRIGLDPSGKALFYQKIPAHYRFKYLQVDYLRYDQLAFEISHALNLNVVPPTKVVKVSTVPIFDPDYASKEENCVVQSAVNVPPHKYLSVASKYPKVLQRLDIPQVLKAIIFNLITGRQDATMSNSVLDEENRVMEIDNEQMGQKYTQSWLLSAFGDTELSQEIIDLITSFDRDKLVAVFQDMENQGLPISPEKTARILKNFDKLLVLINKNKNQPILVSMLDDYNNKKATMGGSKQKKPKVPAAASA